MGQKVNTIGLRVGISRGWDSVWFAKKRDYGRLLIEDYKIREYIKKNVINSGFLTSFIFKLTSVLEIFDNCFLIFSISEPFLPITKPGLEV